MKSRKKQTEADRRFYKAMRETAMEAGKQAVPEKTWKSAKVSIHIHCQS